MVVFNQVVVATISVSSMPLEELLVRDSCCRKQQQSGLKDHDAHVFPKICV